MPRKPNVELKLKLGAEKYAGKFDYRLVAYTDAKTPVKIICPTHGVFHQRLDHHLAGGGCPNCSYERLKQRSSRGFKSIVEKATKVHAGKYEYPEQKATSARDPLCVICPTHGGFSQRVDHHLSGRGCQLCANYQVTRERQVSFLEFKHRAAQVHAGRYRYSAGGYTNVTSKVVIDCPVHGEFKQKGSSHLRGKGCRKCAKYGFDPFSPAYIYLLYAPQEHLFKIGVTKNLKQRLRVLGSKTPFKFEVVASRKLTGRAAWKAERYVLQNTEGAGLANFTGATEWRKPCNMLEYLKTKYAKRTKAA